VLRPFADAHVLEHGQGLVVPLAAAEALVIERQRHVLHGVLETDQVEALEDEADVLAPEPGAHRFPLIADQHVVQPVLAAVVLVEDPMMFSSVLLPEPLAP
jgi:hypothetical protein